MPVNKEIVISGTVQGVGFRPFVWRMALKHKIKGFVLNNSGGVLIKACGGKNDMRKFIDSLKKEAPAASRITSFTVRPAPAENFSDFSIKKSSESSLASANVPADLAVCPACAEDIANPLNRRYLYPFTNCTDCGPRFTIVEKLPYDRPFTSMKEFKMCPDCLKEYEEPADRRFHAQPNACPVCGPQIFLIHKGKKIAEKEFALSRAADFLISGHIVAIKGLGGFHLACDPFNKKAVEKLRKFKDRPFKPFAIMSDSIEELGKYLHISLKEKQILLSPRAPIVALKKKDISYFKYAAPNLDTLGVMAAYTPLHLALFKDLRNKKFKNPLIMTSGNFRDEPITKDNERAIELFSSLGPLLLHNRPIHNRIDDSLIYIDDYSQERIIRRARGYVPELIKLPVKPKEDTFAAGGDIKNSFAFTRGDELFVSQYIGDLDDSLNADFFIETYKKTSRMLSSRPASAVCDMHPLYRSSYLTSELGFKPYYVQHHIAHFFSVMAEYGIDEKCIGIVLDGTGYGLDGKIWGCELFAYENGRVRRFASLREFRLPGGEICAFKPYRVLFSMALTAGADLRIMNIPIDEEKAMRKMIENNFNSPLTSSAGRLFDAFACLILGKKYATYEAQLPMELESISLNNHKASPYDFIPFNDGQIPRLDFSIALKQAIADKKQKLSPAIAAYKFHKGFARGIAEVCALEAKIKKIKTVCCSGGCFQNRKLSLFLAEELKRRGLKVYFNSKLPSNDGGISAGQLYFKILKAEIS